MKQGINLSLGRKRANGALKRLFYISVGVFCLSVVLSLSLIVYRLILKSSYDTLDAKEQQLNAQLLTQQDKKDKFLETKSRIGSISQVISKRSPMIARIDAINQVIPEGTQVNAINGSDSDLQITIESDSLSALNNLIEEKVSAVASDKKRGIKKVQMESFSLNPKTSKYSISLGLTFI